MLGLLAGEMTAVTSRDLGKLYREFSEPAYRRVDSPATPEQKAVLAHLAKQVKTAELAGEQITSMLTEAPGDHAPLSGLKVVTQSGWFAVRPSGTEDVYKLYAESFKAEDHLQRILAEAQGRIATVFAGKPPGRHEQRNCEDGPGTSPRRQPGEGNRAKTEASAAARSVLGIDGRCLAPQDQCHYGLVCRSHPRASRPSLRFPHETRGFPNPFTDRAHLRRYSSRL